MSFFCGNDQSFSYCIDEELEDSASAAPDTHPGDFSYLERDVERRNKEDYSHNYRFI